MTVDPLAIGPLLMGTTGKSAISRAAMRSPYGRKSPVTDGLTRRACDQCHARKIKCDGDQPCARCVKGRAECTFLNPVLPKGPAPKKKRRRSRSVTAPIAPGTPQQSLSELLNYVSDDPTFSWLELLPSRFPTRVPTPEPEAGPSQTSTVDSSAISIPTLGDATAVAPTASTSNGSDELIQLLLNVPAPPSRPQETQPPLPSAGAPTLDFSFLNDATPYSQPAQAWSFSFTTPDDLSPILSLTLHSLVRPQLEMFFTRVYPMIPVFDREDVISRIDRDEHLHNRPFAAMILAMCSLSIIHPLETHEILERPERVRQAKLLMDEACKLQARWDYGCLPTLEQVLTSYLLFGTLFELSQNAGARLRLREALAIGEALRLDDARSYVALPQPEVRRRLKMFWILAITERAYALQRSGSILFKGPLTPAGLIMPSGQEDTSPLRYLARLFAFLDQDIIGCWNGHCDRSSCSILTRHRIVVMLTRLSGPMVQVFGDNGPESLTEVQLADLLVTWQWIRNRIWRLASLHGHTCENAEPVLSTDFPVDVALATVAICSKLSMASMEAHGTGFVEKLFDIASTVTELLQTQNPLRGRLLELSQTNQWSANLQASYHFVSRHRSGDMFAATLGHAVANLPWEKLQVGPA